MHCVTLGKWWKRADFPECLNEYVCHYEFSLLLKKSSVTQRSENQELLSLHVPYADGYCAFGTLVLKLVSFTLELSGAGAASFPPHPERWWWRHCLRSQAAPGSIPDPSTICVRSLGLPSQSTTNQGAANNADVLLTVLEAASPKSGHRLGPDPLRLWVHSFLASLGFRWWPRSPYSCVTSLPTSIITWRPPCVSVFT